MKALASALPTTTLRASPPVITCASATNAESDSPVPSIHGAASDASRSALHRAPLKESLITEPMQKLHQLGVRKIEHTPANDNRPSMRTAGNSR